MQDFSSSTRVEGVWFSAYAKKVSCALQETIWLLMTLLLNVATTQPSQICKHAIFILGGFWLFVTY